MRTVSKMISLLVMAFFLSGLFGLYTVSCCLLWLECNTVPCICQAVFSGGWVFPPTGEIFFSGPGDVAFSVRVCYALPVAGRRRTRRPCRIVKRRGMSWRTGPRRFTCSPGRGAAGGTPRWSCTRQRVSRAGAVRPPGPAVQAIRLCSAWSCSPPLSGRRCRRFAGRWPLGRPLAPDDSGDFLRRQ